MRHQRRLSRLALKFATALMLLATPVFASHRPAVAITAHAQNSSLTASASAKASSVQKVTTTSVTNADGSITTTTTTLTRYPFGRIHGIAVSGVASGSDGLTLPYAVTLKNLSAPPVTVDSPPTYLSVTVEPSPPPTNRLSIIATQFGDALSTLFVVLKPPSPSRTTSEVTTPAETRPPTVVAPTPTSIVPTIFPTILPPSSAERGPYIAQLLDVGDDIEAVSKSTEDAIRICTSYKKDQIICIADSLGAYADALERLSPRLPVGLRGLPSIVRGAALKVRASKTVKEAVHAVDVAIAQVHKTISLLRADDKFSLDVGTREADFVIETLQVADIKLLTASGL